MVGMTAAGQETAEAIHREAAKLFAAHGYEATSLRQIAAEVGIKVGSLYNHISGKEELLLSVMGGTMDELNALADAALADVTDPVDRLIAFTANHMRFHAEHAQQVFIGNTELRSLRDDARAEITTKRKDYRERIEQHIVDACGGDTSGLLNVRLHAFSVVAIGTHLAGWYRPDGGLGLNEIVGDHTKIVLRSLTIPNADARVDKTLGALATQFA